MCQYVQCVTRFSLKPKNVMYYLSGKAQVNRDPRSEQEDDYEYKCSVPSNRTSKNVSLQALYACSVQKTRTRSRPRPPV